MRGHLRSAHQPGLRYLQPAAEPATPARCGRTVKKALRLTWATVLVVSAVRGLNWLLAPALPLLLAMALIGLVLYVAVHGRRGL